MPIDEHLGAAIGDRVTYMSMAGLGEYEGTILALHGQRGQYADIIVQVTRSETLKLTKVPIVAANKMIKGSCSIATRPMWTGSNGKAK